VDTVVRDGNRANEQLFVVLQNIKGRYPLVNVYFPEYTTAEQRNFIWRVFAIFRQATRKVDVQVPLADVLGALDGTVVAPTTTNRSAADPIRDVFSKAAGLAAALHVIAAQRDVCWPAEASQQAKCFIRIGDSAFFEFV
jgi:hypothetical protein